MLRMPPRGGQRNPSPSSSPTQLIVPSQNTSSEQTRTNVNYQIWRLCALTSLRRGDSDEPASRRADAAASPRHHNLVVVIQLAVFAFPRPLYTGLLRNVNDP